MTYLTFHLVFLVPALFAAAVRQPRPLGGVGGWRARMTLGAICAVALVYTTPWDNYLVYRGVWTYGADRVIGTIGYVPIEEYLFFVLQPLLTTLVLFHVLARVKPGPGAERETRFGVTAVGWVYGAITMLGAVLLLTGPDPTLYLGLILAWSGPVLLGTWAYAGPHLWRLRRPLAAAVAAPTAYLWMADWVALHLGIWSIDPRYATGIGLPGLPVEEALFFLVTNVLVVQGAVLFLHGDRIAAPFGRSATGPDTRR